MKRWRILPGEFPKVNTDKFTNSSEDVDVDDTDEQVTNTIRRLEALQQKKRGGKSERPTGKNKSRYHYR